MSHFDKYDWLVIFTAVVAGCIAAIITSVTMVIALAGR